MAELELVNDLFRGRVSELEGSETSARRPDVGRTESEARLRHDLDAANKREAALKRKVDDMEREIAELRGESSSRKKVRVSDLTG